MNPRDLRHFEDPTQIRRSHHKPSMLIASPHLTDPNFKETVLLLIEHQEQGAIALIVNRPTDERIATAFKQPQIFWVGDPDEVIWFGGPVMENSCWMLHEPIGPIHEDTHVALTPDLVLSSSIRTLQDLTRNPPSRLRFIRGMAGWGPAQLEGELASGLWLTYDLDPTLIFDETPEQAWRAAYDRMGIDPGFFSGSAGVH